MNSGPARRGLKPALVAAAAVLLLVMVLVGSSCGQKTTTTPSTGPKAITPVQTAPTTAPPQTGPGGLPLHLNSAQIKKIDLSKNDFTFAMFGDNRGSTTVFPRLIDQVNADNVLFAFDNGDLVDGASVGNYRLFLDQIAASKKPFLVSGGNHDDSTGQLYTALFGPAYYDFAIGNSMFIVLDDSNGTIDSAQLGWLKAELVKGQSYKYRFVVMHVPLYDPRFKGETTGHSLASLSFAQMLNALFDQQRVTLLMTSHIHGYYDGVWGQTRYIMTGGAGAPLYGADPVHYFNHYVRVHVTDAGVTYEPIHIQG
ncbi:MAG TPA: metallophosphoesterase [Candidatus Anoxymicrobiaceae bacterium]